MKLASTLDNAGAPLVTGMRAFAFISVGQIISLIGSGLTDFALSVWVYQTTGSITSFALVGLSFWLPLILFSPIAGALVDRWNRRTVMILSDSIAAFATLVIMLLLWGGILQTWHIYLATLIKSTVGIAQRLARMAAMPQLVPAEQLGRANGISQGLDAAGQLVAPVLAGFLVGVVGVSGVVVIDLITFAIAIGLVLLISIPYHKTNPKPAESASLATEIVEGWRYLTTRPGLLAIVLYFTVGNFLATYFLSLLTPLVLSFTTPAMLGLISSIGGVGMLIGSVFISVWGGPRRRIMGVFWFTLLGALALSLSGVRPSVPLIAAAAFIGYFTIPITNALANAVTQSKVALEMQGRYGGVSQMLTSIATPLGYLSVGPLADRFFEPLLAEGGALAGSLGQIIGVGTGRGIGLLLMVTGILFALNALGFYLNPRARRVEVELPDAIQRAES